MAYQMTDDDSDQSFSDSPRRPTARTGRPRSTRVRQIDYTSSITSDSSDEDVVQEHHTRDEEGDSVPEQSDDSDFGDSDSPRSNARLTKKKTSQAQESANQPVLIPMGTKVFESILDYDEKQERLLIKYKNTSYHNAEWIPRDNIEKAHLGKHRVKKFLQKWEERGRRKEDFEDKLKIDRLIDEGEIGATTFYLVKWNTLFYEASTWESEEMVKKIDSSKLDEFRQRRQIPDRKSAGAVTLSPSQDFEPYKATPKYRYDNELRSYQLEGLNWLRFCHLNNQSCILADEMGLGKTVQSVAFLDDIYQKQGICGPFLIVAPLSTIPHWERAVKAWTYLNAVDFRGSLLSRNLIVETEFYYRDMQGRVIPKRYKFDILITTYEMASAGAHQLRDIEWKCAIFDEAHRLKNKKSKVGEILKTFHIDHKILLTGTPLQNNLDELHSLLNFINPEEYNDERDFIAEYGALSSATQVEKLQNLLKPIMLRRFKEDVETTIPVKEETMVEVELTNPQKKWYRAILEKNFSFLKKGSKSNKEMPHLRNIMMQLRKCCIHPYLLEGAEEVILSDYNAAGHEKAFECLVQSSGKLVLIDKLLAKLQKGKHKVLIFSQFTSCLDILADYLRGRNYPHERIDGSVPGEQRQAAIDRFSTLPIEEAFVFLLCTRAGGVGINLTAADTCIIFDSDWNPQNDLQAQARCHRIGQTKPVQIYRLICRNTYEKDMFDRAGMKLGLDKAVMQRMNSRSESTDQEDGGKDNRKKNELSREEIEDLLKKGAYGAMLDDEASTKFCEEDIDQILERRTTVIRHEGNEKGSVFSKASFAAAEDRVDVELDDPDFWEKWASKANIDTTEMPDDNDLIVYEPRRRRQVQRYNSRIDEGQYSSNDNAGDSDAYEDEGEKSRKREQPRPWTLSEKTKYERKLMIYGYGRWDQMKVHFPRRTEKDLKSVTRALMRTVLPMIERNNEEDRKLVEDIEYILENDADDEVAGKETIPFAGANKRQTTEYQSFLIEAPADYIEHIQRKGRNFLLRIQMLYLVRDKIVPTDWEEAKQIPVPKVTGNPPADWWGDDEDRALLLGICKYGYQQYLTMRNDPEFCFYGRKYDDSRAGALEDDDTVSNEKKAEDDVKQNAMETEPSNDDAQVYVWPSKADIGMRLRRIIAAFLREQANDLRKQKIMEKEQKKENDRMERQRQKDNRTAEKQKAKQQELSNRWTKKNKADFLRTILSFGVETRPNDPTIHWDRFREISGLEKRPDKSLNDYYDKFVVACEEIMKQAKQDQVPSTASETQEAVSALSPGASTLQAPSGASDAITSRESSMEPSRPSSVNGEEGALADQNDNSELLELVPYDKARRSLKRIEQMKKIREEVVEHPNIDLYLQNARKTSGLPSWWQVPEHDKALLQGICKHGYSRADLVTDDPDLPFFRVKQQVMREESITDLTGEGAALVMEKLGWPKDIVIARRIETLCQLILKPKPPSKRQLAASRKRKLGEKVGKSVPKNAKIKLTVNGPKNEEPHESGYQSDSSTSSQSDEGSSDSGEDTDTILEEATKRARSVNANGRSPTRPLKSQTARKKLPPPPGSSGSSSSTPPPHHDPAYHHQHHEQSHSHHSTSPTEYPSTNPYPHWTESHRHSSPATQYPAATLTYPLEQQEHQEHREVSHMSEDEDLQMTHAIDRFSSDM